MKVPEILVDSIPIVTGVIIRPLEIRSNPDIDTVLIAEPEKTPPRPGASGRASPSPVIGSAPGYAPPNRTPVDASAVEHPA